MQRGVWPTSTALCLPLDSGTKFDEGQGGASKMAKGKLGRMSQFSRALEPFSSSSRTRTLSVVIKIDSGAEWIGLFALSFDAPTESGLSKKMS